MMSKQNSEAGVAEFRTGNCFFHKFKLLLHIGGIRHFSVTGVKVEKISTLVQKGSVGNVAEGIGELEEWCRDTPVFVVAPETATILLPTVGDRI